MSKILMFNTYVQIMAVPEKKKKPKKTPKCATAGPFRPDI
jgi:hypothetical protein